MGDSTCLMQPFSYVSGIPNDAHEGNPVHALGQSVSFGRFMSESLSWEKWSTFSSHNKYVEEAERYARPGSVAQKKAFFEAHYKSLAARKAAALLEQANAAAAASNHESEGGGDDTSAPISQMPREAVANQNVDEKVENFVSENQISVEDCVKIESSSKEFGCNKTRIKDLMQMEISKDESSSEIEKKPLLQNASSNQEEVNSVCKKKQSDLASKLSTRGRECKVPSSPARLFARINPKKEINATPITKMSSMENVDRKRSTPKSSQKSMNFTPAKDFNKFASSIMSRVASSSKAPPKNYSTPLRTPKHPSSTPWSENKSARTPVNVASGTKSVRRKWGLFPTENKSRSSSIFSPFTLKTEERAARRKQKLEEKFNSRQTEKMQQQATLKEKAETEFRKLRQSFCFKARPLPDFYKERKLTTKDQIKQLPVTQPESPPPVKQPISSAIKSSHQGKMSSSIKNIGSKLMQEKKGQNSVRSFMSRAATMVAHENTSPNIQHSHAFAN